MAFQICTPALASSALFAAIIILDLANRDYGRITPHFLFGIFATLLVLFICQRGTDMLAWSLLAFPFVLLLVGWIIGGIQSAMSSKTKPASELPCCESGCPYGCPQPCNCPSPKPIPVPTPKPEPPSGCVKSPAGASV